MSNVQAFLVCAYLFENSSKVSSPCSELLWIAEELKGDLAQRIVVLGATRAALGATLMKGRSNDEDGRAAARRMLKAIELSSRDGEERRG